MWDLHDFAYRHVVNSGFCIHIVERLDRAHDPPELQNTKYNIQYRNIYVTLPIFMCSIFHLWTYV